MNDARRKQITEAGNFLYQAKAILETVAAEEREYHDNMPESIQAGEKGDKAEEVASALEAADQSLDEAISSVEESLG